MPSEQCHAIADAQFSARVVIGGPIEKKSGQDSTNYPVSAGGFHPNASVQTPKIAAIGKNTLKNQCVDFVARAMH
jgi:hypothetical protein